MNSLNRDEKDTSYHFTIDIPNGIFECKPDEMFRISVQDFNMGINWLYCNETNNQFLFNDGYGPCTVTIPPGNYRFKDLAVAIETAMTIAYRNLKVCTVTWSSTLNKFIFQFNSDGYTYSISFLTNNPAYYILGFEKDTLYTMNSVTKRITSPNVLKTTLSNKICITVDNIMPAKGYQSVENKNSFLCQLTNNIMSIPNDYAPFDTAVFISQNDNFALYCTDNIIQKLTFSLRDEDGDIMTYASATEWRASIKIDTFSPDRTYQDSEKILSCLNSIEDYLRMLFVSRNLPSIK